MSENPWGMRKFGWGWAVTLAVFFVLAGLSVCQISIIVPLVMFLIVTVCWLALAYRETKSVLKTATIVAGVMIIPLMLIIFAHLAIVNCHTETNTAAGFKYLKPQLAALNIYSDGKLDGIFTNGMEKLVEIHGVRVFDLDGKLLCESETVSSVAARDNFRIHLEGCDMGGSGEVFNIGMEIEYVVDGYEDAPKIESGMLRGLVI